MDSLLLVACQPWPPSHAEEARLMSGGLTVHGRTALRLASGLWLVVAQESAISIYDHLRTLLDARWFLVVARVSPDDIEGTFSPEIRRRLSEL